MLRRALFLGLKLLQKLLSYKSIGRFSHVPYIRAKIEGAIIPLEKLVLFRPLGEK